MLVEFSVENFRSIAERQVLSLVAGTTAARRKRRSISTGSSFAPKVLRTVSLFGANGGGKSSFLDALTFLATFVHGSSSRHSESDAIAYEPHKLDKEWINRPSDFEVIFVAEDCLYQYGFSIDQDRVHEEWLYAKPNAPKTRMRELFTRYYDVETGEYLWSIKEKHVKGEREVWKRSTRDNALFLSTAVQLNSESLRPAYDWITKKLKPLTVDVVKAVRFTPRICLFDEPKEKILRLLSALDTYIVDIRVEEADWVVPRLFDESLRDAYLRQMQESFGREKDYKVYTIHKTLDGELTELKLDNESSGTQTLFWIAGPWLEVLDSGSVLIVDELQNSLHPHALRFLVDLFHDPEVNRSGAQLIFSSHETAILSKGGLHRDEICFVERDAGGRTHLTPLSDIKGRDGEAFQKGYLGGRYGGLPKLGTYGNGKAEAK